jgi:hypothetical protein
MGKQILIIVFISLQDSEKYLGRFKLYTILYCTKQFKKKIVGATYFKSKLNVQIMREIIGFYDLLWLFKIVLEFIFPKKNIFAYNFSKSYFFCNQFDKDKIKNN